jgi:hypothetical protein
MSFNLTTYLRTISQTFSEFQTEGEHFVRASSISDIEELLQKMSKVRGFIIVAIDTAEGVLGDGGTDVWTDKPHNRFYILTKVPISAQIADIRQQALSDIKAIANKILYKMVLDRNANKHGLRYVDLSHVPYLTVGPMLDGFIGVEFFFNSLDKIWNTPVVITPEEDF